MTDKLNWHEPVATIADGPPTRIVDPPSLTNRKFVFWGGAFRAYLLDGTPYNATLRKREKYRLRNVEEM